MKLYHLKYKLSQYLLLFYMLSLKNECIIIAVDYSYEFVAAVIFLNVSIVVNHC